MFSFNYNNAEGLQLSNTDYTMCVRMERNFCGIQYTACADSANTPPQSFSITGGSPTLGSVVGTSCSTDWITIPCATNTNDPTTQSGTPVVCVDRICGQVFNSATTPNTSPNVPVYSYSKPFNIYVHTDSLEGSSSPTDSNNRFVWEKLSQEVTLSSQRILYQLCSATLHLINWVTQFAAPKKFFSLTAYRWFTFNTVSHVVHL